jgi:carbon starvation protein CstA
MGADAVVIGAIVSVVLTIVVIAVIAYKVVRNMEDSSNDN